jgi:hypothetical protein
MGRIEEVVRKEYEDEGIVEDMGPVLEMQADKRFRVLEWIAGGLAMATAGVVVERLAYRHAHAV